MDKLKNTLVSGSLLLIFLVFLLVVFFFRLSSSQEFAVLVGAIFGVIITTWARFVLSSYDRRHQLRLAALDKRLAVHQEAFTLWNKLVHSIYKSDIGNVVLESQDWWYRNCLYLDENPRWAFRVAYMKALDHGDLVRNRADYEDIKESWNSIISAGRVIMEAVSLPPIGEITKFIDEGLKIKGVS
jgi:hypothetical protein